MSKDAVTVTPRLVGAIGKGRRVRSYTPSLEMQGMWDAVWKAARAQGLKLPPFSGGSMGDTFENDILKLIFNGTAIANIADNAAASPLTSYFISFHTADPGDAGSQTTNEATYVGYARTSVARSSGGWTVTTSTVNPTATINGAPCTSGSNTLTHFGIGSSGAGPGKLLFSGTLTPNIAVTAGVTPQLLTGTSITAD